MHARCLHHLEMLTCGTVFGEQGLQKNACTYGNSINFFKIFKFRILKSINFKKIQLLLPIAEPCRTNISVLCIDSDKVCVFVFIWIV